MSEFSDAYYLFDVSVAALRTWLRELGRFSLILPPTPPWTPILIEGVEAAGTPLDVFSQRATFRWIHYAFAEDHGLWLRFFDHSREIPGIAIQARGSTQEPDGEPVGPLERAGVLVGQRAHELRDYLDAAKRARAPDLQQARRVLSHALGVALLRDTSCADLTYHSVKTLKARHPDAEWILANKRGKLEKPSPPEPNRYCPVRGMPRFMYLPVPEGYAEPAMLERHVRHWLETRDFDDQAQEGFWLYTAYTRALPSRYRYLADRVMNLEAVFPDHAEALRDTVRGILAVSDASFDWHPYLERRTGGQRL